MIKIQRPDGFNHYPENFQRYQLILRIFKNNAFGWTPSLKKHDHSSIFLPIYSHANYTTIDTALDKLPLIQAQIFL